MATFTNQATLSYNGTVVNSNVVTGEIVEALSISKTALSGEYGQGDTLTYVISVINSGSTNYSGLTLIDDLGAYEFGTRLLYPLTYEQGSLRVFTNGLLETEATVADNEPLTLSGISVPAGGNVVIVYNATLNSFAPLDEGSTITNTATLSGMGITSISASETVVSDDQAILEIIKAIDPVAVLDNQPITYTFTILNTGNTPVTAEGDAVVSDLFAPILSDLTVTLNGVPLAEGEGYNYDENSGLFTTVPGVITVPAASYTQSIETGEITLVPGTTVLTVSGTV